ncbi:MAG: hypothetical protein ACKO23_10725 [Gemmataceae bacterium]
MRRQLSYWSVPLALAFILLGVSPAVGQEQPTWRWFEVDSKNEVKINLYIFWSATCHRCPKGIEFARGLEKKYPWLQITWYEISAHETNKDHYRNMASSLGKVAGQVPAFFFCKDLEIGWDSPETTGARIEKTLVRWHDSLQKHYKAKKSSSLTPKNSGVPALVFFSLFMNQDGGPPVEGLDLPPELEAELAPPKEDKMAIKVPVWGEVDANRLSLPTLTVVLAGCDAFNPCAFFVLLFLLGMLIHTNSRWRMLLVGGIFVFFSGLIYFLFMAAWLNLFFVVGHMRIITLAAGVLAILAALINIKDYFWFKQGISLSIPEQVKPGLYQRIRRLMHQTSFVQLLGGTVVLAVLVNLYELLCTAGFPMVYTRVLTLRDLSSGQYYLYLALYNLVYVLPLAAIVIGFSFTLGSHKLSEFEGRVLKLVSGMMMLVLGVVLLVEPEWLNQVGNAILTLIFAIGGTALIVLGEKLWQRRGEPELAKRP